VSAPRPVPAWRSRGRGRPCPRDGGRPVGRLGARLGPLVAAAAVLAAGLAVRAGPPGPFSKYAGVALYATLIHTLVVALAPRLSQRGAALAAGAFCFGVELAQLTPWPAALSSRSRLARLVLGSTFHAPDLLCYVLGVAGAVLVRRVLRGVRRSA